MRMYLLQTVSLKRAGMERGAGGGVRRTATAQVVVGGVVRRRTGWKERDIIWSIIWSIIWAGSGRCDARNGRAARSTGI